MATSGRPSPAPPNQADIRSPLTSSTMVEAWHDGKGADSKMNSSTDCARAADASMSNNGTIRRMGDLLAVRQVAHVQILEPHVALATRVELQGNVAIGPS